MTAFASVDDLATPLARDLNSNQVDVLMDWASDHLRHVIGQDVFPQKQSTYTGYPSAGREDLPQWPIVSVDAVLRDGFPIAYTYRPGYILVDGDDPVDVTFTWGMKKVPGELKRLACVLASQALQAIEATGGLTAGGLSSIGLDDFKAAFADGGAASGIALTPTVEKSIRDRFGRGDVYQPGSA